MCECRRYHFWLLVYLICGMSLSITMAISRDLTAQLLHTQLLFIGLGLGLVYGVIHELWLVTLPRTEFSPAVVQTLCHIRQSGLLTMFTALLLGSGEMFFGFRGEPAVALAAATLLSAIILLPTLCRRAITTGVNL